uniref:Cof-type HAD-IIB family hydrolase n=1 Tax=Eubacterium cellulosolvens TaxID=29322 RepID=UPI000482BB95|nr:Cof-type HAD-IIB family hydrolase [[Eubacterium] cellulosolvens]
MNQKIVFLDIDGTLTTMQGTLPDSAEEALKEAAGRGHQLVICSGRTITQIYPWLLQTGYFSGVVSGAGAEVRVGEELVFQHLVDREQQVRLVDYLEACGAYYYLQCTSGIYAPRYVIERKEKIFPGNLADPDRRVEIFGKTYIAEDPHKIEGVNKFVFYRSKASIGEIREFCGDYFEVTESSFRKSDNVDGEITVRGYDKSEGMRQYLKAVGKDLADTIAFGDGPNDHEMLETASTGVAMGNASDDLKEKADLITAPIDRDGLYKGFEMLGLVG